jgi:hypothetical protein
VIAAIRAGHVFTAIDAFAGPARLLFTADGTGVQADAGDRVASGTPLTLRADVTVPQDHPPTLTLFRDGQRVTSATGARLEHQTDGAPGVYRVEATLPVRRGGGPLAPWLVSNPIYVGPSVPFVPPAPPAVVASRALYTDGPSPLAIEKSEQSAGAVDVVKAERGGTQLSLRFALGGRQSDAPFVAFATAAPEIGAYTGVKLTGRANRPMRLSLQLRTSAEQASGRWRRSVYLDETSRTVIVPFSEFKAAQPTLPAAPPLGSIGSLIFVLDTMNTALGTNGELWLDDVAWVR